MLNLNGNEQQILDHWKSERILERVREGNRGRKPFYFLDGPPYASGQLAAHHIWVETIKDLIIRYKRYRGYDVHDRAGFDVHGLPVEVKVEKKLGVTHKMDIETKIGIGPFVNACKDFANEQIKRMVYDYTRFGSSLDFEHAYLPYEKYYIEKGWQIFKRIYAKGLVYSDLQGLAYCPKDETVLSAQGPEVEYSDSSDPSILVAFKVASSKLNLPDNTYFVIWTTTPWTLPSNMAIAVSPGERYVSVRMGERNYIVAKARFDSFAAALGANAIITNEFSGSELKDSKYISPLEEKVPRQKELRRYHKVLLSETFVTVTEGTGILHVAPGHGPEDFKLGKENKMPIMSPVDEHAQFTDEAGSFKGLKVPDEANKAVLDALKENGSLLHLGNITHSYPHCWRCHSKLIYRATEQWFINIKRLKKRMLRANARVKWHPEEAKDWFSEATESSPDWTISRQRYWGSTIPIWVCGSCKEIEVMGSSGELEKRAGLGSPLADLHKPSVDGITFKCSKCGGTMKRIPDIFDVWYDAGIAHTASLSDEEFGRLYPADWITESRDQIRGWFAVLLRTSIAAYGTLSFKRVNIGGMIKDEIGQEMHRHLGNIVSAEELLDLVSADGYRLWCSSHPRWLELKLKKQELAEADSNIITIYNISELVKEFNELSKTDPKKLRKPRAKGLDAEERWILSRFNTLVRNSTMNLDNYFIDDAVKELRDFVLDDFSRFYLRMAKRKVSSGSKRQARAIASLVNYIFYNSLIMLSPIIPFSTEKVYLDVYGDKESAMFNRWPKADAKLIDAELEKQFDVVSLAISALLNSREKKGVKLRWPIADATIELSSDFAYGSVNAAVELIKEYINAKSIVVKRIEGVRKEIRPSFQKLGPDFKGNASLVAQALKAADADAVISGIEKQGFYELKTNKGTFRITKEHIGVSESFEKEDAVPFKYGVAYVNPQINEELKGEALLREFERRVQMLRKERGLKKTDKINLFYSVPEEYRSAIKGREKELKGDVGAVSVREHKEGDPELKEYDVDGDTVRISLSKA